MVRKESRTEVRVKKHKRLRNRFSGTAERPRLAVFRSNNHMYAQIIDDTVGNTLVAASTLEKDVQAKLEKTNNVEAAAYLGEVIAKKALDTLEVDRLGLDTIDRAILTTMITKFRGGPVGTAAVATTIGEDQETVEEVYEPYLVQTGLIVRTPRGRMVTAEAYEHLGIPKPEGK